MNNLELDALARLLDGDLPEAEATDEARSLAAFAQALEATARPAPVMMERKADLRAMLVEAAREQATAPSWLARMRTSMDSATSRWRYSMRTAAATGAAAMALSTGGVALAAHRSTPSDPFYAVKLTLEDIRLAFIGDELERGRALMANANERLAEAEASAAAGDMAGARRALEEADAASRTAAGYIIRASQDTGDAALLELLTKFSTEQRARIAGLLPLLSGDARGAAKDAMVALARIDQRVAVLSGPCTACDQTATSGGGGRNGGRNRQTQDTAAGEDFDLSVIPPADEPFSPCDCTTDPAAAGGKGSDTAKSGKNGNGGNTTGTGGSPGDDPKDPEDPKDPDDPGNPDPPEDDDPLPALPDPAEDVKDGVDDVIDDILEGSPSPLPIPSPPGTGNTVPDILP